MYFFLIGRHRGAFFSTLIEKGFIASKATTKKKAFEIVLNLVEAEHAEPIISDLLPFLSHKQPKLVAASINCITEILKYPKTIGIN